MKRLKALLLGLSVLGSFAALPNASSGGADAQASGKTGDSLKIMISPELSNLTMTWINEFKRVKPDVTIKVGELSPDQITKTGDICLVSQGYAIGEGDLHQWKISIGHQAIVPVFNVRNPMRDEISRQGICVSEITALLSSGAQNWSDILNEGQNKPVTLYITENNQVLAGVSGFTKIDPAALKAVHIKSAADFVAAIQKNPYAIGFCNLADIRSGHNELVAEISLLPIDKNANGRIDHFENIYSTPDDFSRGVWIGKYPHALSAGIYATSADQPVDRSALDFLTWITNNGGPYLVSAGYCDLTGFQKQVNLTALTNIKENERTSAGNKGSAGSLSWLIIPGAVILLVVVVLVITLILARMRHARTNEIITITPAFNENTILRPNGLFFDRTHTWAYMEQDGTVKIGIDDFMQHITGTITRVILKEPGEFIRRGDKMLTIIRYGKQLNLYSPVTGTIKSLNHNLNKNSSLINASPFTEGWVYMLEPANWLREIQLMFMGEKYRDWLREEFSRLRNFFEVSVKSNNDVYSHVVLQDGGELKDNVLANLEPEVWEEFQSSFIDPSR